MATVKCTLETCDIRHSVYGYRPNLGENVFFTAFFAVILLCNLFLGIRYRQWSFMAAMVIGCLCESTGSAARIMLYQDPFSMKGLKIQLVLLTIAPAFLAAGIYFCLKHLVIILGSDLSRLPAAWYTYIFITCDLISLILQGIGGGMAAGAPADRRDIFDTGNDITMAGLAFQVFTLTVFAVLSLEFAWQVWRDLKTTNGAGLNPETHQLRNSWRFKGFITAMAISYVTIQTRCIYRLIEMSGGWGNPLMQKEILFTVLESTMIAIAVLVFVPFHPGFIFANLQTRLRQVPSTEDLEVSPGGRSTQSRLGAGRGGMREKRWN